MAGVDAVLEILALERRGEYLRLTVRLTNRSGRPLPPAEAFGPGHDLRDAAVFVPGNRSIYGVATADALCRCTGEAGAGPLVPGSSTVLVASFDVEAVDGAADVHLPGFGWARDVPVT